MRQEVYRQAWEEANSEHNAVLEEFERLKLRKGQLEAMMEVLKPLVDSAPLTTPAEPPATCLKPEPVQQVSDPIPSPPQYVPEETSDPLQRAINHALWGRVRKSASHSQAA
jgi:hypothetical protein